MTTLPPHNSAPARVWSALVALFWLAAFSILWIHVPFLAQGIALAWAGVALAAPRMFLLSLALALPLFGNNPGGPHHLYLLDMGIMAYVVRRCAERALRPRPEADADAIQSLLAIAFLALSTAALTPQIHRIACEIATEGGRFLFANYSHYGNSPVFGIHAWTSLALSVALFGCLRRENATPRDRYFFLLALMLAAVGAAILGLLEYSGLLSLQWWRPDNPYITRFGYRRVQSLFWHSGWFAQYLVAVSPVALALALSEKGRAQVILAACWLLLGTTELFTMQRGAWLGFIAGSAAVTAGFMASGVSPETRRHLTHRILAVCGLLLLLLGSAMALHSPLRNRVMEMTKISDRAGLWGAAWEMGMRRPLTGLGFGNFTSVHLWLFPEGSPYFNVDDKTTAHSLLLHTFAERGAVTATVLLMMLGGAILGSGKALWKKGDDMHHTRGQAQAVRVERLAVFGALCGVTIEGMFQYSFYIRLTEVLVWIWLAWASRLHVFLPGLQPIFRSTVLRVGCPLVLAVFLTWSMRDYFSGNTKIHHAQAGDFIVGGKSVELAIPAEGSEFSILLYSADPKIPDGEPVTFAIWFGDRLLGSIVFSKFEPVDFKFSLPPHRESSQRLKIVASRVWNPYQATERLIGLLEAGVCHQALRVLNHPVDGKQ